jgi:hypothetical protein
MADVSACVLFRDCSDVDPGHSTYVSSRRSCRGRFLKQISVPELAKPDLSWLVCLRFCKKYSINIIPCVGLCCYFRNGFLFKEPEVTADDFRRRKRHQRRPLHPQHHQGPMLKISQIFSTILTQTADIYLCKK